MLKIKKKTPHLAVVHESQGGSANMRHASLIMKSVDEMSPEEAALMNEILGNNSQEIEKATYYSLDKKLGIAVQERVQETDRWGWSYVRDFDDTHVVYSGNGGVFAAPYTESDGVITLGEEIAVNEMLSWEDKDGKIIVSQSDNSSSEVKGLVIKSFDSPKLDNEKLINIFKSKYEEDMEKETLQQENAELKSAIEKSDAQVKELQAQLEEIQKSQKEALAAQRKEVVKSVTTEDNFESLFESVKDLDEANFNTIIKSLKDSKELAEKNSGLFEEIQKSADSQEREELSQKDALIEFIKNQQK